MARRITDDEQNLRRKARRRLIGAVALTLVVVVILPMILDSEPKSNGRDIELSIPDPADSGDFKPGKVASEKMSEKTSHAATVETSPMSPEKKLDDKGIKAADSAGAKTDVASGKVKTDVSGKVKSATKPAAGAERFVVQVGAYSSADTAKQELNKLKKLSFKKAYTEVAGEATRVRVGPYAEREKAENVRQQLEKHGLHPVVMSVK